MDHGGESLSGKRGIFPLEELAGRGAAEFGPRPVMRWWNGKTYDEITYAGLWATVQAVARWLIVQGLHRQERVAVLGQNGPEWAAVYLGSLAAGAVIVPVDPQMPPTGISHVLSDSEARILFASGKYFPALREIGLPATLERSICLEGREAQGAVFFSTVIAEGARSDAPLPEAEMDDPAAILYTSGTTGHSKGVMLTQRNIMSNVAALSLVLPLGVEDVFLSVLPMHHTYECTVGFLLPLYSGSSITFARSMKSDEILEDIRRTRVTLLVGVPLLFEKMHAGMLRRIRQRHPATQAQIRALYGLVTAGERVGLRLGGTVFAGLREKAGLSSVRYFIAGAAPLDPAVSEFFNRLGIVLLQGYGLTEASPVSHVNLPARVRHGTVGPPIPGVECRIADPDARGVGEICIRGPNVFAGYYHNEQATREVFDGDGWFHTGDLGKVFPDRYLRITGRKKNVLVTAGGKNVYPEEIEQRLVRSRFILETVVLGAPRQSGYGDEIVALVHPDYEQLDLHFESLGRPATDEDVAALLRSEIRNAQRDLEEFKLVRRFRIVEEEFQKTSSRKIKRYLYSGEMVDVGGKKV